MQVLPLGQVVAGQAQAHDAARNRVKQVTGGVGETVGGVDVCISVPLNIRAQSHSAPPAMHGGRQGGTGKTGWKEPL